VKLSAASGGLAPAGCDIVGASSALPAGNTTNFPRRRKMLLYSGGAPRAATVKKSGDRGGKNPATARSVCVFMMNASCVG